MFNVEKTTIETIEELTNIELTTAKCMFVFSKETI